MAARSILEVYLNPKKRDIMSNQPISLIRNVIKQGMIGEKSEFTYLLGMFFIINVVLLSSPRNMRSTSSSYSFFSALLELDSLLR